MRSFNVELFPRVGMSRQAGGFCTVEVFLWDNSNSSMRAIQPEIPCAKLSEVSVPEEPGRYRLTFRLRAKKNSERFADIDQYVEIK